MNMHACVVQSRNRPFGRRVKVAANNFSHSMLQPPENQEQTGSCQALPDPKRSHLRCPPGSWQNGQGHPGKHQEGTLTTRGRKRHLMLTAGADALLMLLMDGVQK